MQGNYDTKQKQRSKWEMFYKRGAPWNYLLQFDNWVKLLERRIIYDWFLKQIVLNK